eukprot:TRINITY_DN32576_c0_g1_i1.p3 TRINITY_DN32576_c0_g1~~TRINITY_DN32576_c0_g1_i1.p3  ORF type:complete len:243 (+),score=45.93 TRINITY_DN32576_c0_g1_i1:105-833(+)
MDAAAVLEVPPSAEVILRSPGNSRCFDCDVDCVANPWVSLTYGTVLCLTCAGVHRSLGVHISFVRSLALDSLKEGEVEAMLCGGNARFEQFLQEEPRGVARNVWLAVPLELRYFTPAADLYRRRLKAEHDGVEPPEEMEAVKLPRPTPPPADTRRTRWTPDSEATKCELCHVAFTFFMRRHHCRRCGRCICAECSPPESMRPVPARGDGSRWAAAGAPCRHCKLCVLPTARTMPGLVGPARA